MYTTVRRLLVLALLGGLMAVVPAGIALGCVCASLPVGDPVDLAGQHSTVHDHAFIGTVNSVRGPVKAGKAGEDGYEPGRWVPVVVDVEVRLKGAVPGRAIVLQQSAGGTTISSCAFDFAAGRRYLVEAHRNSDGTFQTNACTFTQPYGGDIAALPEGGRPASSGGPVPLLLVLGSLALAAGAVLWLTLRDRPAE